MPRKTKAEYMDDLRERFRKETIVRVLETSPQLGGARERDIQRLVDEGVVSWMVVGEFGQIGGHIMSRYTADELDAFALDDLRRDAEQCERQAADGPFYPDRQITKESLLAYAARCREVIARCASGGAHAAVLAGIMKPERTS